MTDLNKKTITIAGVEAKDGRVKVTDQDGVSYSFFQTKQDGSQSKAYQGYQEFKLALNSIIEIGYKENGKYKNIAYFSKPSEIDVASAQPFVTKGELKSKEPNWDNIAQGKVRHAFAVEAYKLGFDLNDETVKVINRWVNYVMTGKLLQVAVNEESSEDLMDISF